MRRQIISVGSLFAALAVCGCASPSSDIQPAFVSAAPYFGETCQQLADGQRSVGAKLLDALTRQDNTHDGDVAGVLLIGLPVGSMFSHNSTAEVATYKGEQLAIERAWQAKQCSAGPS